MQTRGFIDSLKQDQPQLWALILKAGEDGLIMVDEPNDAVTATNRLLLTYPGLHDLLAYFTDQWIAESTQQVNMIALLQGDAESGDPA